MERGILTALIITLLTGIDNGAALTTKCNCNCPGTALACGKNPRSGDLLTFKNPCQLICRNCTQNEKWILVKSGECDKTTSKTPKKPKTSPGLSLPPGMVKVPSTLAPSKTAVKIVPSTDARSMAVAKG